MASEVEETFKRIKSHKGVEGIIILNNDGFVLKTTLSQEETNKYASQVSQLTTKTKSSVRIIDSTDELTFLRIRSQKHEIMIAPDKEYILVVIQNPNIEVQDIFAK